MFDKLIVKDNEIIGIKVNENVYIIKVCLHSRYMNYIIDLSNSRFVSGSNTSIVQQDYILTFEKIVNAKKQGIVRKCPGCGESVAVYSNGICKYCRKLCNLQNYNWILCNMEIS